jgi:hypothetical protein
MNDLLKVGGCREAGGEKRDVGVRNCLNLINDFLKAPGRHLFLLFSITMEPHCAIEKKKNLLVHVHNKLHQSNLNSF